MNENIIPSESFTEQKISQKSCESFMYFNLHTVSSINITTV